MDNNHNVVTILLVEDNPGDVRLISEAFKDAKVTNKIDVVNDGLAAMDYLFKAANGGNHHLPGLILLDLNLPKKSGREVLKEIKEDSRFKKIPVAVLTSSKAEEDIVRSYELHANCYVTKPVDVDDFLRVVRELEVFWLTIVKLLPTST